MIRLHKHDRRRGIHITPARTKRTFALALLCIHPRTYKSRTSARTVPHRRHRRTHAHAPCPDLFHSRSGQPRKTPRRATRSTNTGQNGARCCPTTPTPKPHLSPRHVARRSGSGLFARVRDTVVDRRRIRRTAASRLPLPTDVTLRRDEVRRGERTGSSTSETTPLRLGIREPGERRSYGRLFFSLFISLFRTRRRSCGSETLPFFQMSL